MQYVHSRTRLTRRGASLVELMVVLVVLALTLSVVALAVPQTVGTSDRAALADLERRAVVARTATTSLLEVSGSPVLATAYPDGGIVADTFAGLPKLVESTP